MSESPKSANKTNLKGAGPGRPKGSLNTKDILAQAFEGMTKEVTLANGTTRRLNGREQMLYNWARRALKSDRATEAILNRTDGMPIQTTRTLGERSGLNINVTYEKPKEDNPSIEVRPEKVEPEVPSA